jgi:sterol desaturase/sphingolipid hydroxylase (fatty acid hydroxylase superfamily)
METAKATMSTPNNAPEADPISATPRAVRFVNNDDASCRMFKSDIREVLSHVPPWAPHAIFLPVVGFALAAAFRTASPARVGALLLGGLLLWTLLEYVIHRSIFHPPQWIEDDTRRVVGSLAPDQAVLPALPTLRHKFYFVVHGVHHDYPNDSTRLVMPPSVSIPLSAIFFLVFLGLFGAAAPAVFAGFIAGYLVYDTIHFVVHHAGGSWALVRALKRRHFRHHYADSSHDFGVSSPLWDVVLGTLGSAKTGRRLG